MPSHRFDILVIGVGFTGVLVAKVLAAHRDRDKFSFALGGRSQAKLDHVLSAEESLKDIPRILLNLENFQSLEYVIGQSRAVINCTSHYWKTGESIVRCYPFFIFIPSS